MVATLSHADAVVLAESLPDVLARQVQRRREEKAAVHASIFLPPAYVAHDTTTAELLITSIFDVFDGGLLRLILRLLPIDQVMAVLAPLVRELIPDPQMADLVLSIVEAILRRLKQQLSAR